MVQMGSSIHYRSLNRLVCFELASLCLRKEPLDRCFERYDAIQSVRAQGDVYNCNATNTSLVAFPTDLGVSPQRRTWFGARRTSEANHWLSGEKKQIGDLPLTQEGFGLGTPKGAEGGKQRPPKRDEEQLQSPNQGIYFREGSPYCLLS
jgi:hypothetical protein